MASIAIKIIGCLVLVAGLVLAANPELVSTKPVPTDTFQAIERRIWWGLLIGIGLLPLFHFQLRPWGATIAGTLSALVFGLLVARFIGIALDGSVAKQWLYVGIEAVILAPFLWWYFKARG